MSASRLLLRLAVDELTAQDRERLHQLVLAVGASSSVAAEQADLLGVRSAWRGAEAAYAALADDVPEQRPADPS